MTVSSIAFDNIDNRVPLSVLQVVDGANGTVDDGRITQNELDIARSHLDTIQAALPGAGTGAPSGPNAPAPEREDRSFFGRIGDFFGNALKWLGDLADNPMIMGGLGLASVLGWFIPGVGAIVGAIGMVLAASNILSGLLNEDREVNWWMLIPAFLFGVQMFNPESAWGIIGGVAGYFAAENSPNRDNDEPDPSPAPAPVPPPGNVTEPVRNATTGNVTEPASNATGPGNLTEQVRTR